MKGIYGEVGNKEMLLRQKLNGNNGRGGDAKREDETARR